MVGLTHHTSNPVIYITLLALYLIDIVHGYYVITHDANSMVGIIFAA